MVFTSKMFEKHLWKSGILSKDAGRYPQVFFKHFASKNQLPGLSVSGTLVENGLSDRKQRVVLSDQSSSWIDISAGVTQRSILEPLLFSIYINDLSNDVKSFHIGQPYLKLLHGNFTQNY